MTIHRTSHARRTVLAVAAAVLGATALAGCGGAANGNQAAVRKDGSVDLSKGTLVVGDQKGGSQSLLQAAGELNDVPYTIKWQTFTSGPPLLEALNAGAIDIGGVGNTPPLFAAAAKSRFKVVEGASYGGSGDALVVPKTSPIKTVAQLKGKKVAVAEGSSANYNLLAQLQKAGLKYSDVQVQNLQPADALAAFSSGHVDAWAIWEPYTSQAVQDSGARVLVTGRGLVNGYSFQAASDAALADKATRAALEDYLSRIAKAQVWSKTHKAVWAKVWAQQTGLSDSITLAATRKRDVVHIPIDQKVIDSEQGMADAFAANKLIPGKVDVSSYFISDFNNDTKAN
jgi:sulfonate transport system substrate-binding protein